MGDVKSCNGCGERNGVQTQKIFLSINGINIFRKNITNYEHLKINSRDTYLSFWKNKPQDGRAC